MDDTLISTGRTAHYGDVNIAIASVTMSASD